MQPENDYQNLKKQVWSRTFSSSDIQLADHYFRLIAAEINSWVRQTNINRPPLHWHTVRNFYTGRSVPQLGTLDLLATFAIASSQLITYHEFSQLADQLPQKALRPSYQQLSEGKWRVKVTLEVPIILEIENLPTLALQQEE